LGNEPPYIFDIEITIKSMRSNKASGIDNIPIKLCKKGGQILTNMPHSLIKRIWIEGKVPMERSTNITVPTYKNKGDKLQCQNYRGISLLCTGYTVLTTVLNNILKYILRTNKIG
jgi:hypothetical protein